MIVHIFQLTRLKFIYTFCNKHFLLKISEIKIKILKLIQKQTAKKIGTSDSTIRSYRIQTIVNIMHKTIGDKLKKRSISFYEPVKRKDPVCESWWKL